MSENRDSGVFLVAASVVSVVLSYIPFAGFLVYPFKLFVTFIHEGGHALVTLLTFGSVQGIAINLDTSGTTQSIGGISLLISSAGYLTSTIYGALLLLAARSASLVKAGLALSALAVLALTLFFVTGFFGWLTGIGIATILVISSAVLGTRAAHFFLSFLAVQCCLNAIYDLRTLFVISAISGQPSDAMNMQRLTLIPAVFWALAWMLISLVILWVALRGYFRAAKK